MRIVLPLVSAAKQISGVQRHAINAAACILNNNEITKLHLVAGSWQQYVTHALPASLLQDPRLEVEFISAPNTVLGRNLWYGWHLPTMCEAREADIVHLAYPVPVHRSAFRMPVAVTLHDLYPYDLPENFGFPKVLFNRSILRQCLDAVDAIACVSGSTLERLDGLQPRFALTKAVVVPNVVERAAASASIPSALVNTSSFLLCVAQHRRNKNILLLLQVYLELLRSNQMPPGTQLIVVGINGPETPAIHAFIQQHNLQDKVMLLAGLSDKELWWCYEHCRVLVAPSVIEGFGLPVAEGLVAGCRVVCSDIPAHREVGSTACQYVANTQDAVARYVAAILEQIDLPRLTSVPLPQFSVRSVSRQYRRLYQSLLRSPQRYSGVRKGNVVRPQERELEA